jgi:transcriptional regulator with XRE-family HTH domain
LTTPKNIVSDLRLSKGWGVSQLAQKMGVKKQTIYNWEAGKTEPKLGQFLHLYALVGLDIGNIIPQKLRPKQKTQKDNLRNTSNECKL